MIDFRGIFDSQDDASKKSKRRNDSYIFMNWSEANAWNWRGIWSGSSLLVDIEQKTRAPESLLPRRSRHTIFRGRVHATVFPFYHFEIFMAKDNKFITKTHRNQ